MNSLTSRKSIPETRSAAADQNTCFPLISCSGKENPFPAKIVCVRNKANRKDWLAFLCTDPALCEEEIIRIYGKRWQIEVFFKTCKSMLNLIGECHSLSYDALTAHTAIVFTRYMLLALEQRQNEDQRTLGELFFFLVDEMAILPFQDLFAF